MPTAETAALAADIQDPVHHDQGTVPGEGRRMLMKYLEAAVRYEASDLIVKVDLPPRIRLRGALKNLQTEECSEHRSVCRLLSAPRSRIRGGRSTFTIRSDASKLMVAARNFCSVRSPSPAFVPMS